MNNEVSTTPAQRLALEEHKHSIIAEEQSG